MRGKPPGKAVYNVFLVGEPAGRRRRRSPRRPRRTPPRARRPLKLPRSDPSPDPSAVAHAVRAELAAHGGSWAAWSNEVAPLHAALKRRLAAVPAGAKALPAATVSCSTAARSPTCSGGDLGKQPANKNPMPAIVRVPGAARRARRRFPVRARADQGGDVPRARGDAARRRRRGARRFAGQVVNPFERKFLADLAASGVETVDLLPAFLAERAARAAAKRAALSSAGHALDQPRPGAGGARRRRARTAVSLVPGRRGAPPRLSHEGRVVHAARRFAARACPRPKRRGYAPETLVGQQVVAPDGALYDDDPDSPVVVLGDSFTGVYQLMDCEHAGVSAHLAKELGTRSIW